MNRKNLSTLVYILGILIFIFAVFYSINLYLTDPYFYCVTIEAEHIDSEDYGERCFKTKYEVKNFTDYIKDKYYESPIDPSMLSFDT